MVNLIEEEKSESGRDDTDDISMYIHDQEEPIGDDTNVL